MAVQITGRQIANSTVGVAKLILSTGSYDFSSGDAVVSVNTPTADSHAASKSYVDAIAQGLHWKDSVRAATTANITLSGTQTIDGVSIVAGDRVLVKNQTDAEDNGIYVCEAGAWSRSEDMDVSTEFSGSAVFVQEGTANADTGYVCTNNGDVTVGTTEINFTQFTGAGQLSAGNGIDITNSTISADLDGATLSAGTDGLKVSDAGIDTAQVADSAITNAKLAGSIAASKLAGSIPSDKLNLGNGVEDNGGNLQIDLDGATLALSASGIKVADAGIDTAQIAADAIDNSVLADDAVQMENFNITGTFVKFTANGSQASFELAGAVDLAFKEFFVVAVNGLLMDYNASTSTQDEYYIDNGGAGGVGRIVFGANLTNGDKVTIRLIANT